MKIVRVSRCAKNVGSLVDTEPRSKGLTRLERVFSPCLFQRTETPGQILSFAPGLLLRLFIVPRFYSWKKYP